MRELHNIFSKISPEAYSEASVLSRHMAENMIARLELVNLKPKIVLDVGPAAGHSIALLKERYPDATIVTIDSSDAMLRFLQKNEVEDLLCAETQKIPLKNHSVDLIFANAILPWCQDWQTIFLEWRRVLRPEGLLMFSCFGLDTLRELQGDSHLLQLKDMHEVGDTLVHAKFSDPVMDVEYVKLTYRDKQKLIEELQVNGMITSDDLSFLKKNDDDVFSLTFEMIYGHAFGPQETVDFVADETGTVKIPLSYLRRRR